jgi:hypothetical protein
MEPELSALSAAELADLAGVTTADVDRLVDLGIVVARHDAGPFRETDAQKVRLAGACEQAGLPMAGIAAAIQEGRLSFAFLDAAPFRRWAVRSARTYRQVSQQTGIPLEVLAAVLEAMGFARPAPDEPIRGLDPARWTLPPRSPAGLAAGAAAGRHDGLVLGQHGPVEPFATASRQCSTRPMRVGPANASLSTTNDEPTPKR